MESLNTIISKNKKFSDLLEEIYINQKKKEDQVSTLINELKPLISEIGDATLIVPLIKEYLDISVKNDEHLIKMATIIQRAVNNSSQSSEGGFGISEEEKQQLLSDINKLKEK